MAQDSLKLCSRRGWSLDEGHIIFQKKSSLLRELNTHTLFILAEAGNQQVFVVTQEWSEPRSKTNMAEEGVDEPREPGVIR